MGHPVDVRKMPAQYLTFKGIQFRRETWAHTKVRAQEIAKEFRETGRMARVISFNHRWFIYQSPKPEKESAKHYLGLNPMRI